MKLLITGGAGFIGSALIRYLLEYTDYTIINVDKLTYAGNLSSLKSVDKSERYHFYKIDICDREPIQQVFQEYEPDAVIHLAAESHVDRSIDGPAPFIQSNIIGTYTLLEVALEYWNKINNKLNFRFHHVSTDEVYGDVDITKPSIEKSPYFPSSPYSASKSSSDHLVNAWYKTYGLPTVISNCSNNYGPYQFPEKLIPLTILNAIEGKIVPVYGDGENIRDWIYVEDHVQALHKVLREGVIGETYNISSNEIKKNIEVVYSIFEILEELQIPKPESLESFHELIDHVQDRPGHDRCYCMDSTKIRNELNWQPVQSFASGLRKTIEWYISNRNWYEATMNGRKYNQQRPGFLKV